MNDIRQAYLNAGQGNNMGKWFPLWDYKPLVASMGFDVLLQVDEDDYQGDSFLLLKDGNKWGFLTFGWGSCSGCDALQACDSWEDAESLRTEMASSIKWHEGPQQLRDYWGSKDWEAEWFCRNAVWNDFSQQAVAIIEAAIEEN